MYATDDPTLRTLDELFDSGLLPGYSRPRPYKSCICVGAATASRPSWWIETGTIREQISQVQLIKKPVEKRWSILSKPRLATKSTGNRLYRERAKKDRETRSATPATESVTFPRTF